MVKYQRTIEQIAGLALIGAIVVGCVLVLRPFISAILWAAILCFATWPLYELFRRRLRGRHTLAAALTTAVLALVLIIPFVVVGLTFTDTIHSGLKWLDERTEAGVPPPPAWVESIPLVGERITKSWQDYIEGTESTIKEWKPWLKEGGRWLLGHSVDLAKGLMHLVLSVLIAFFFYRDGEGLVAQLREGMQRISGDSAQRLVDVVKTTVQSVVYGVIGTALAQGIVAGIGFAVAGTPAPMLLALFTFFLSFLPFGPPVVWIGASIWLFAMGKTGWGIFMVLYGLLVISLIDNFIKPIIISRGSKLSFIVMFIGVLGGVAAFGLIGIFIGPTLLAVGFSLAHEILEQRRHISTSVLTRTPAPAAPATEAAVAQDPPASTSSK
ncbi:MAG: AI-2E family transporter [Planctomycetes bacterium]|nr:AI-2E family transporter [Planctomycetota bacterium]